MRSFCLSIGISLAKETSHRFWAFLGVEWVLAAGISAAILVPPDDGSAPIRLAFYEIAVVLIPVLLGVYLRERRDEIDSRAKMHRRARGVLQQADGASFNDEAVTQLRQYVERAPNSLKAATALTVLFPAAALTGEAIALFVIATGSSTMFSYVAVMTAVVLAALGAVLETASGFSRTTE